MGDYIFGYSVANDVSARDVQYRHKQNFLGKSLDTFFAMGPVIVTADEFPCPPALSIRSFVNGELRQNSVTDQVFFNIRHIVSELSQGMTLPAGTILITGTPAGVGMGMDPPCFLKRGDVVTCEIDGIGRISNPIRSRSVLKRFLSNPFKGPRRFCHCPPGPRSFDSTAPPGYSFFSPIRVRAGRLSRARLCPDAAVYLPPLRIRQPIL